MRASEAVATAIGWLNRAVVAGVAAFVAYALWHPEVPDDAYPPVPGIARAAAEPLPATASVPAAPAAATPAPPALPARTPLPGDDSLFMAAARRAWVYVEQQYQPATGWINSVQGYPYSTIWDLGSSLSSLYCGHRLGLLGDEEYDRRMGRALQTLREVPLFDEIAFNKNYNTRTGRMAGRNDRDQEADGRGYGYSAMDVGRLLVWLQIIARNDARHADAARAIAQRLDLGRMVQDGYLMGEDRAPRSGRRRRYQEGRIPYEQYSATGFALWGQRPDSALSLRANALPADVYGIPLMVDRRGYDRVTSEPVILAGLEVGWTPEMAQLAVGLLGAQQERWRRTGQVTAVSEDAIPRAPFYFYYYSVLGNGRPFAVDALLPRERLNGPRWVSTKAAFAWHALLPGEYTLRAVNAVGPAGTGAGWGSGVYERSGTPTGAQNINTAAVVLQAALYHAQGGRALIDGTPRPRPVPAPSSVRADSAR